MNIETLSKSIAIFAGFLDFLTRATPIAILLGGLFTYYYREKLKSYLAKSVALDVERLKSELARQMADHTLTLQRDLEAYKVGLIAETERIKAGQDVRKSIALKVAEKRFLAIAALFEVHLGIDTDIGALSTLQQSTEALAIEHYRTRRSAILDRLAKYAAASDGALLFISEELRSKVQAVRKSALTVMNLRFDCTSPPLPGNHPEIGALLNKSTDLESELRKLLVEFEQA